jgi:N-acetylglutamate synthase-like GNAT family acetyltransferase
MPIMKRLPCPENIKTCKFLEMDDARPEDTARSVDLVKKTFPHMFIPAPFLESKLKKDQTIIIKENGTNIIAVANVALGKDDASLDCIAVDRQWQGKGIGASLLQEAENVVVSSGKKTLKLMTERDKIDNIAFYSKHGYRITGYEERGYSHCPGVHFEKRMTRT